MYVAVAHIDRDSRARSSPIEQQMAIAQSSTLYIGNLSFYTTEEQMYELFARVTHVVGGGGIKRIIMGLDRNTKTPCGFAFVEYVALLTQILYARGSRRLHALRLGHQAGRACDPV